MLNRLRLASGLILTLFVLGHFINHALGIISLRAMNDALKYFIQPWREPLGEAILVAAIVIHVAIALFSVYRRRTLRLTPRDMAQLVSGFAIPLLLGSHILGTRVIHEVYGVVEGYQFTLYGMWVGSVFYGVLNFIALPVVWFHACLGWHNWFRLKPWYPPLQPYALGFAILLPTLALAGYVSASLRVVRLSNSERWVERLFSRTKDDLESIIQFVSTGEKIIWISVPAVVLAVLAARWLRSLQTGKTSNFKVRYRDVEFRRDREFRLQPGVNLLEQFRIAEIPHASVCGGRGRCSTCRIRVDKGSEDLPPPSPQESRVLERIKAAPSVRLACQTTPTAPVEVTALLDPGSGAEAAQRSERSLGGEEQEIAILFADIREFTKLSETRLPYDTAFLLNRYFAAMGKAIENAGGHLDKFIGDGVMALFGVDENLEAGCQKAVAAAIEMSRQLDELNESLKSDLDQELRIGIGIHSGTAIVGKMGYKSNVSLTAIGDVVNTASRLESQSKELGVQLVISEETVALSGFDFSAFPTVEVAIRGRVRPLPVRAIDSASLKEVRNNAGS